MNLRVFACLLSIENRSIKISLRIAPFKSACYKKNVKINQEFLLMKTKSILRMQSTFYSLMRFRRQALTHPLWMLFQTDSFYDRSSPSSIRWQMLDH